MAGRPMRLVAALLGGPLAFAHPGVAPAQSAETVVGDLCAPPADWHPPFVRDYRLSNGARLIFVAVTHASDPASPTHVLLRQAFAMARPGIILVEGVSATKSADAGYRTFVTERATRAAASGRIGENLYAVKLAAERGLTWSGWDLTPGEGYSIDLAAGYAIEDVIGAHLLRVRVDPFGPSAATQVEAERASVPRDRQPARFDYAGWYRERFGARFDPALGTRVAPRSPTGSSRSKASDAPSASPR